MAATEGIPVTTGLEPCCAGPCLVDPFSIQTNSGIEMSQQKMHLHVICTLQRYAGPFAYHDNAAFHACALAFSLLKFALDRTSSF